MRCSGRVDEKTGWAGHPIVQVIDIGPSPFSHALTFGDFSKDILIEIVRGSRLVLNDSL